MNFPVRSFIFVSWGFCLSLKKTEMFHLLIISTEGISHLQGNSDLEIVAIINKINESTLDHNREEQKMRMERQGRSSQHETLGNQVLQSSVMSSNAAVVTATLPNLGLQANQNAHR